MYRSRSNKNLRSIARGNQRAADQQRDTTQVTLKIPLIRGAGQTYTLINELDPQNKESWKDTGVMAFNIYDVLLRSEYYQNYSKMYDQLRIDSIKVDVTPCCWTTSKEETAYPGYTIPKSLTVITAWDRSGLDQNQFIQSLEDDRKYYCIIGDTLESYSSAVTKHLGPGSIYKITRYLYPNTAQEKNQYVNTKELYAQCTQLIQEPYSFQLANNAAGFAPSLPNNPRASVHVPFKPTFLLGVFSPYKPYFGPNTQWYVEPYDEYIGYNRLRPTIFNLEFEIVVTFRGLRYQKTV